jgi:hypothetical protein
MCRVGNTGCILVAIFRPGCCCVENFPSLLVLKYFKLGNTGNSKMMIESFEEFNLSPFVHVPRELTDAHAWFIMI